MLINTIKSITNHRHFIPGLIIFLIILGYLCYLWLIYYNTYSSDAYVFAKNINVMPQVSGPIENIYVKDNQLVNKGQVLLQIDSRPYQYRYNLACAQLQQTEINYTNRKKLLHIAKDKVLRAEAALALLQDHLNRYLPLVKTGVVPKITLVNLEKSILEEQENLAAAKEYLQVAILNLNTAQIEAAKNKVQIAKYNLDHTYILAPMSGYITNMQLEKGQYLALGKAIFAIVDNQQWWVVTRYRETSLRLIKPGDKVKVKIDMYPHKVFYGVVKSVDWGINRDQSSNAVVPSGLPYLMPTEDWIQIAQRFRVWTLIKNPNPDYPLRIGASARTWVVKK